ncbi:hypothetical protein ES703_12952 [subsurface metagenome]
MEIDLTDHAIDEYRRHLKTGGNPIQVAREISLFFRVKPRLVFATAYTIPRGSKRSRLKGPSIYLARISWQTSGVLLVLTFNGGNYTAVTSLSNREFGRGVKLKRITDIREEPITEDCLYKYRSLEMRISPFNESPTRQEIN